MQFTSTLALSLLPALALAQYGGYGDAPTAASSTLSPVTKAAASSAPVNGVHIVKVGKDGLTFDPNSMTVPVGDTVEFHFWPKAHSVAQSSFDKPCTPLNDSSFFSGPVAIASGMSPTVFSLKVNSTAAIWYYCATGSHCQNGMGGVINPPAGNQTRTITNYLSTAKANNVNNEPTKVQGGVLGAAVAAVSGTATASPTTSTTATAKPGAGNRAAVSWGLLGVAGLVAGAFV